MGAGIVSVRLVQCPLMIESMLALCTAKRRNKMIKHSPDNPMTLNKLRRWVSALEVKGDRDAKAKWMLLRLIKEAQEKERDKSNDTE